LALYYLETSALVKLYFREQGTDRLIAVTATSTGNQLTILSLAKAEFRSMVRRRQRNGEIAAKIADWLTETFQMHVDTRFLVQPVTDYAVDLACTLIDRHNLRAYDAIQLAGYMTLVPSSTESPIFVCSDRDLLLAATKEGGAVLDPTT